jgi:hypothetical protein
MRVKLEEEVVENRPQIVKQALWAERCDACQKVFSMDPISIQFGGLIGTSKESGRSEMFGKFDKRPNGGDNDFLATICSLLCAHNLFAEGGWRSMPAYKAHVDIDAKLMRAETAVTAHSQTPEQLREKWKAQR